MELSSLVVLLPVFQYIESNGDVAALVGESDLWRVLEFGHGQIGLSISLASLLSLSFSLLLLRQCFVFVRLRYMAWTKQTVIATLRATAFRTYLRTGSAYQDREEAGTIVSDLTVDMQRAVDHFFGHISFVGLIIVSITYFFSLLVLSVGLTALACCVFAFAFFLLRGQTAKAERNGREVVDSNQRMSAFLVERLKQARLVRLAGIEEAESARMDVLSMRQRDKLYRVFALLANIEIIMEPIIIGVSYIFLFTSVIVLGWSIEEIGLFLILVLRLLPVMKELARTWQSIRSTGGAFTTVTNRVHEMSDLSEPDKGTQPFRSIQSGLRFENVSFAYPSRNAERALVNLNLVIPAHKMTALVGPSGAGKSTLIDMIPRLRTPDKGAIFVDETPLDDIVLKELRAGIAYAPQSPQIFNMTLGEHIALGKEGASEEEIRWAAEIAGAWSFIERMPEGLDSIAGEGGNKLSGGQRQRLDLARALVRQAPLLLLDEPTSNLDADSEALFRDALARIMRETDTTVVIIAHRLSTVTMSDQIVVMQEGKVEATGSHADLANAKGWYTGAFAKQSIGSAAELSAAEI